MQVQKIDNFTGHRDCVYTLAGSREKHKFFSAAGDGMVVRWNLEKPDVGDLIARVPKPIYALNHDPKRNELWVGQNFEGIHVIDPENKAELRSMKLGNTQFFDIQSYENQAFVGGGDGVITVIEIENFAIKKHIKASDRSVRSIAINPVEREFAAGYSDNQIRIFDLRTFELKYTLNAHSNSVFCLKYSLDFRFLISGSRDAHLKVWDVEDKYSLDTDVAAHLFAINSLSYSPDGQFFVSCSMDKSVKVWDAERFKLLKVIDRSRHAGHGTSVNKVLWTAHDNQILSCSDDRTISVWKLEF
jgi:WD40 repeat protein